MEAAAPLIDLGCASSLSSPSTTTTTRPPSPSTAPAHASRVFTTAWDEASAVAGGGGDGGLMTPLGKTLAGAFAFACTHSF